MKNYLGWVAALLCTPSQGQEADSFLIPVQYDVYLKKENPLYRFGVRHPCGAIVTLEGNKLPLDVQSVELQWAYELDSAGRIKTKWPLPLDASPLAIDGNKLIIHQFNAEEIVLVTVDGGIGTELSGPPKAPPLESKSENMVTCPGGADDGNICSKLVDATTGAVRIISYPLACT